MGRLVRDVRWLCPDVAADAGSFGELIRCVRLAYGLSQGALATRVGVSQPVVSKWESGRCAPLPVTVSRVADALGVTFTMSCVQGAS